MLIAATIVSLEAQSVPARPGALVTSTTEIDGVALRVRSSLDQRSHEPRRPVVVFESGAGIPLDSWDAILEQVAAFATVVAYDRPGTGQSPWKDHSLTPQSANQRLKKLLEALNITEPVILVGHSWGGALARYFAGEYPQMVRGVLYIDPTDVFMTEPMWQQMFASFGATAKDVDAFFGVMESSTRNLPPAVRAESMMMMELLRTPTIEQRQLKPAPKVPSSVLMAGRIAPLPKGMVPFDGAAYATALQSTRVAALRSWAANGGRYLVVDGAGHFVYRDAPDVVVKEIYSLAVR